MRSTFQTRLLRAADLAVAFATLEAVRIPGPADDAPARATTGCRSTACRPGRAQRAAAGTTSRPAPGTTARSAFGVSPSCSAGAPASR